MSAPATYRLGTPRNQSRGTAGRVSRWPAHLRGLATAIHEISGLDLCTFKTRAAYFEDSAQKAEGALSVRELMSKEEAIEVEGTVVETLPNAMFRWNWPMGTGSWPISPVRCASIT